MMGSNIVHQTAPIQKAVVGAGVCIVTTALQFANLIPTPPSIPKIKVPIQVV